jgi:hypothetical protein
MRTKLYVDWENGGKIGDNKSRDELNKFISEIADQEAFKNDNFFAFSWPFEGGPASFISALACLRKPFYHDYKMESIEAIGYQTIKKKRKKPCTKKKKEKNSPNSPPQLQTKKKRKEKKNQINTRTLKKSNLRAFRPVSLLPRRQQRSRASSQTSSRSLDPLRVDQPVGWPPPLGERKYRKGSSGPGQERPLDHQIHSPSHHCTNPEPEL